MTRFDLVQYRPHDQTYLVGGKVITAQAMEALMGNRPYQHLSGGELARVLGEQLAPRKDPVFDAALKGQDVETVFRVGPDGRPEAVTRLVDKPSKGSVRNAGESELAWLQRRVNEICNWRI